ncbi:hypothetical protein [Streptomyces sp. enrichment culture]|uniref:hypothetical protein n=1 Tax=Streptomyces sp. enrichment culture TaxID=1795815 RepID=UPI003F54CA28
MTDTTTTPITNPEMEATHYGVQVCPIGDDGDLMALGHPGVRRAFAAFNRHARVNWHLPNLADDCRADLEDWIDSVSEHWAVLRLPDESKGEDADWEWVADWADETTPGALAVTVFRAD